MKERFTNCQTNEDCPGYHFLFHPGSYESSTRVRPLRRGSGVGWLAGGRTKRERISM